MTISVKRINNAQTTSTVSIGNYHITVDIPSDEAAPSEAPAPHDLYDAALGACTTLTVLWYANKKGMKVDDIVTSIDRDSSEERKGVYRLSATVKVSGDLTDEQIKELAAVAEKCPVHKLMTTVTTEITSTLKRLT